MIISSRKIYQSVIISLLVIAFALPVYADKIEGSIFTSGNSSSSSDNTRLEGAFGLPLSGETNSLETTMYSGVWQSTVSGGSGYKCGDVNDDDLVDISDAVFLINFVFVPDAQEPMPYESGDVNCDDLVDISDAVFVINFVFVPDSPAPCECK